MIENSITTLESFSKENIDNDVKQFSKLIIDSAKISIGLFNNKSIRPRALWWNKEIKTSIENKNKSLKKFQNSYNPDDFIVLKQHRTRTRFLLLSIFFITISLLFHSKASSSLNNQTNSPVV